MEVCDLLMMMKSCPVEQDEAKITPTVKVIGKKMFLISITQSDHLLSEQPRDSYPADEMEIFDFVVEQLSGFALH